MTSRSNIHCRTFIWKCCFKYFPRLHIHTYGVIQPINCCLIELSYWFKIRFFGQKFGEIFEREAQNIILCKVRINRYEVV